MAKKGKHEKRLETRIKWLKEDLKGKVDLNKAAVICYPDTNITHHSFWALSSLIKKIRYYSDNRIKHGWYLFLPKDNKEEAFAFNTEGVKVLSSTDYKRFYEICGHRKVVETIQYLDTEDFGNG